MAFFLLPSRPRSHTYIREKLSLPLHIRHGPSMRQIRIREEEDSSHGLIFLAVGALAGLAAGMILTERLGGLGGITRRVRQQFGEAAEEFVNRVAPYDDDEFDDADYEASAEEELEERVLETFRNDPILSERAIDIEATGHGIIELTGWVHAPEESVHAVTIARGTPDVETVVNRITVRDLDERLEDAAGDYDDEEITGGWSGRIVGTGRRRHGGGRSRAELDRQEDPAQLLKERAKEHEVSAEGTATEPATPRDSATRVPRADHVPTEGENGSTRAD